MRDWLGKVAGLEKLSCSRPSTAVIGNWGLVRAVRELSEAGRLVHKREEAEEKEAGPEAAKGGEKAGEGGEEKEEADATAAEAAAAETAPAAPTSFTAVARVFASRGSGGVARPRRRGAGIATLALAPGDGEDEVAAQWAELRREFTRPKTAILFHLKNHYAMLFALREWVDTKTGTPVRQLLTARKGQRPTAWIDWQEARETMIGWKGYQMASVRIS